eukprot:TRINITY_DN461_c0_g1_i9.p1 TRINITY_DN461_c0_g1~~TRINITY_DN461_c0_g1_i9.p1  ORF type:complete len:519 (+),score=106.32 TRINITY_DN461_c0_g1_i9:29-1585(+)
MDLLARAICCHRHHIRVTDVDLRDRMDAMEWLLDNRNLRHLEFDYVQWDDQILPYLEQLVARQQLYRMTISYDDHYEEQFDVYKQARRMREDRQPFSKLVSMLVKSVLPFVPAIYIGNTESLPCELKQQILSLPSIQEVRWGASDEEARGWEEYDFSPSLFVLPTMPLRPSLVEKLTTTLPRVASMSFSISDNDHIDVKDMDIIFSRLARCSTLTVLSLQLSSTPFTCSLLKQLFDQNDHLFSFECSSYKKCPVERGWGQTLATCRNMALTHLSISGSLSSTLNPRDVRALAALPALRSLVLEDPEAGLPASCFEALASLSSLTCLRVTVPLFLPSKYIAMLGRMSNLECLHISDAFYSSRQSFQSDLTLDNDIQQMYMAIAKLPNLESYVASLDMDTRTLQAFGQNRRLRFLRLGALCYRQYQLRPLWKSTSIVSLIYQPGHLYLSKEEKSRYTMNYLLRRNRLLLYNWQCIALLIVFVRANRSSPLANALLYLIDDVTQFVMEEDVEISRARRVRT